MEKADQRDRRRLRARRQRPKQRRRRTAEQRYDRAPPHVYSPQTEDHTLPYRSRKRRVVHHGKIQGGWSAQGLVSRASSVHTAVRNCTRDEGRPFEVGNQVLISSHGKLLSSKAMVVNVSEKSGQRFRQARLREASASEPSMKCRKRIRRCQNRGVTLPPDQLGRCPETAQAVSGI